MDLEERSFLRRARRGFLATADDEGRPAVVPVCFALVDGDTDEPWIATPVDEKPKDAEPAQLRRVRDVTGDGAVALVVDRYDEDWDDLAWVQVRGRATLVAPGEPGHAAAVGALREDYDQYADHALPERPIVRIDPGTTRSWAATGDLGAPEP